MSASTPSPHRQEWLVPGAAGPGRPAARSPLGTAFDVVARIGTAVTLAALLVVIGTTLGAVQDEPTPAGVSTAGR